MKKLSTLVFAAVLSVAGMGCGNDSILAGMGGALGSNGNEEGDGGGEGEGECGGDAAEQEAAIADLGANICADCNAADGTAEHLFAKLSPHEYEGGALEVGLVIGSPNGLAGLTTKFQINEIELAIPADAWKTSDDGTVGRVVLFREAGLPQGEYAVYFAVEAAAAFNEEETPPPSEEEVGTSDHATWKVDCAEAPGEEPGEEEPTDEPHGDPPTEEPGDEPPTEEPPAEEPPADAPPAE